MAEIDFVYFDLGNVLLHFDHNLACRQMAEVAGLRAEELCEFFQTGDLLRQLEEGKVSAAAVHEAVCRQFGCCCALPDFERAGSDIFWVNRSLFPLTTALYKSGIRLGVLSNTCASHWEFIRNHGFRFLQIFMEQHVLSYRLGATKPALRIYEAAADVVGVAPNRIYFCDDRPEHVEGARRAGWRASQYRSTSALAMELRQLGLRFAF